MKRKFSLSKLLYHDKLMMLLSLICAVVIWALVISGPSNMSERVISTKVTVDLTNSTAEALGFRIIGQTEFDVQVKVSGVWSVITKLTENDVRVSPDLSDIKSPGEKELALNVNRNSLEADYDFVSISPSTITVACDRWKEGTAFELQTDLSLLSVSEPETMRIGEAILDRTAFPSGKLTVEGPEQEVDQIASLVARVPQEEVLSDIRQYDVPVIALNEKGEEVSIPHCSFKELPENKVSLTVPVWVERHIKFGYKVENAPKGLNPDSLLSVTPAGIDVLGPAGELDALEQQVGNLGILNFRNLSLVNNTVTFPLNIPKTVRVVGGASSVKVQLDTTGLSSKTLEMTTSGNTVKVEGKTSAYTVTVPQQKITGITLVGKKASVDAVTAADLSLVVDVGDAPTKGTRQYDAVFKVNGYDDVWVYYGSASNAEKLFVNLS